MSLRQVYDLNESVLCNKMLTLTAMRTLTGIDKTHVHFCLVVIKSLRVRLTGLDL
eukprot:SAG31_NODE_2069_length_6520_cov_9.531226_5_plen_55_part_00